MSEETGGKKYLDLAMRTADYIWDNYGSTCVCLGATREE